MGTPRGSGQRPADPRPLAEYPLLPLRGVVVFPHMLSPLEVGRPRSVAALEQAAVANHLVVLAAQRDPRILEPGPEEIYSVGTVAELKQILRMPGGRTRVLVEGHFRARIVEFTSTQPALRVRVEPFAEEAADTTGVGGQDLGAGQGSAPGEGVAPGQAPQVSEPPGSEEPAPAGPPATPADPQGAARIRDLLTALDEYVRLSGQLPIDFLAAASLIEEPGRLADTVAAQIPLPPEEKQWLLETADPGERLERLVALLHRAIEVLDVQRRIQARLRRQAEKAPREAQLREQVRAMQRELGERDERQSEFEEYRRRIEAAQMPDPARQKAEHELARLEKMPPLAAEAVVVRTYLDWLVSLPWAKKTEDRLDIAAAEQVLEADHYGLERVKERVLEFLAVRQLTHQVKGPVLCLVGPPGVGKTSLARSVARALERQFVRFSLGGVRDEAEIRGHRRTYVGAMPGKIIQAMRQAGYRNPVMLLDEIDKMAFDYRGDPASALLEVLDPEQNHAFADHYLEIPFDLSDVLFITTGNVLQAVPRALRDRMETITLPGYTEYEKVEIAVRHLVPRQVRDHGLQPDQLRVGRGALGAIVRQYTREAGVRELERHIAALCRKTALQVAKAPETRVQVTPRNLARWLGPPRYYEMPTEREHRVGLALGLAYTDVGGDLLAIEVAVVPGRGKLWLTGKLGEVMRESAQASFSYVRARAAQLGVNPRFYEQVDIHVHVPEGAIPKDGPSAGITMAAALASALTGRPVRRDVVMTGELTLRGRVLPVGGIKEKVLAAHRYGVGDVVLPRENVRDLEELPEEVRRQLRIHPVDHMDEVLELALLAPVAEAGAAATAGGSAVGAPATAGPDAAGPDPASPSAGADCDELPGVPPDDGDGDMLWAHSA